MAFIVIVVTKLAAQSGCVVAVDPRFDLSGEFVRIDGAYQPVSDYDPEPDLLVIRDALPFGDPPLPWAFALNVVVCVTDVS